jgi:cellobiose phosphorylase
MNIKEDILVSKKKNGTIKNSTGLIFSILENGSIKSIEQGEIQINLINGSPLENGCFNIYLRKRANEISAIPLFGPNSNSKYKIEKNIFEAAGQWEDINYSCRLLLSEKENSWLWDLRLENLNSKKQELDLICVQDVGLTAVNSGEKNELYVSQYIDYTPILHKEHGHIVCCRQNEHGPNCIPWLALGSISNANSFSTDGMQFFGPRYKEQAVAKCLSASMLPGLSQQELAVVALQEKPFILESTQAVNLGFYGIFCQDHPAATGNDDVNFIEKGILQLKKLSNTPWVDGYDYQQSLKSLFTESPLFLSENLTETEINKFFGSEKRHCEYKDDRLLSFFYGEHNHVVLREKELITVRPHGHIMKTGSNLTPDDSNMSLTSYMFGVFQSHITQGNVNFNRFLTVNSNPLNIPRYTGQRIFILIDNELYQLGIPSAFEMSFNQCRWIYKNNKTSFEVISEASKDKPEITLKIKVLSGNPAEWIISNQLADEHKWSIEQRQTNGREILKFVPGKNTELARKYPEGHFDVCLENSKIIKQIGNDSHLFEDCKSRGVNFLTIELSPTKEFTMIISGCLAEQYNSAKAATNLKISANGKSDGVNEIFEIMPWYFQNAQIHYLAPRGLEQFSGAAWGTRDVCQGSVEMLLSLEEYSSVRKILSLVFSNQNADGNWPQWWMYDNYNDIRFNESHGDVIFWPILAVSQYISSSGDFNFLNEELPYYKEAHVSKVIDHIHRAMDYISNKRFVSGTSLVNYDGGDWNDSMQPANKELKKQLVSSWTVILSYQAFKQFAEICHKSGFEQTAEKLEKLCESIKNDFNRYLIKNDVVAGFGFVNKNKIDLLLHPSDSEIGIHYSLIPMTRGIISGIFTPDQAKKHYEIIEKYLKGPDGARLMDKSPEYNGGLQCFFKRAESCPFFGREIGLMYTHAHLRYAQALAKMGKAREFVNALRQAVPIELHKIIPQADIRQSNCYYSSSDAGFESRCEANRRYEDLLNGKIALNGGWRVYSSGPGIFINNVISNLAGIRHSFGHTIIDPVLPKELDGLNLQMAFRSAKVNLIYQVSGSEKGVTKIEINDINIDFERESNPYRPGGAVIEDAKLKAALNKDENLMRITI